MGRGAPELSWGRLPFCHHTTRGASPRPAPTIPEVVSRAPFPWHYVLHSCTFLQKAGLGMSLAAQKVYFRAALAKLHLQVANKECNFFAPNNWAPSIRNPLRMPTESLLTRANKLPALACIFASSPFPEQNEQDFCYP